MPPHTRRERLFSLWVHAKGKRQAALTKGLALRGEPFALAEEARCAGDEGDGRRALALTHRAQHQTAAYNMAMDAFNRRDFSGYRRWLRLAARLGDEDAARLSRRFETRLPHGAAFDIGRGRPYRLDD